MASSRQPTRLALISSTVLVLAVPAVVAGQGCDAREQSRWVATAATAVPTHRYGSGDTWLATVGGIATVPGKVFVFDEGKPAVSELSATLVPVREWGRSGRGPGEFSGLYIPFLIRSSNYNYLGVDAHTVVVYDRNEIEVFDTAGTFSHAIHLPDDTNPWSYGLLHARPFGASRLLAVVDSVDRSGRLRRRLQAWSLEGRGQSVRRTLLWELTVPSDTGAALNHVNRREARPFWGRIAGCQAATDGTGPFLLRYDELTGHTDSLALPQWRIPEWGDAQGDGAGVNVGGRRLGSEGRPVALARWLNLVVDPDGWAWVRAWTEGRDVLRVVAVSLGSGEVVVVNPPAFPRAFGEAGVFYGTMRDPETDEILLIRYEGKVQ